MISLIPHNGLFEVKIQIREPSIYLDHWALNDFSQDPLWRPQILKFFETKGTLFVSFAHILDLTNQGSGASLESIKSFLNEIGPHFIPIYMNPGEVIKREEKWMIGDPELPCYDIDFMKGYVESLSPGPANLARIVKLMEKQIVQFKKDRNKFISEFAEVLNAAKEEFNKDLPKFQKRYHDLSVSSNYLTPVIYYGLMRTMISESFKVNANNITDFMHATVAIAYGQKVFLDCAWKEYYNQIPLKPSKAEVFCRRDIQDLAQILNA